MNMENIKYYKDLNHNYLVIKEQTEDKQSYGHKMITANRLKYFVDCKIRYVNRECHFYYEISSKQNIVSLYGKKTMGYEQIRGLFEHINEALAELDNYLLNSKGFVLEPEYIFGNPENGEYFFLYYPHYEWEEGAYLPLAEFLLERVEHQEEDAAKIVYEVYEMAQDNEFILSRILDLFTEKGGKVIETMEESAEPAENTITENNRDDILAENRNIFSDFGQSGQKEPEDASKHLVAAGILSLICMAAAAGVAAIPNFCIMSSKERILSLAGSIVLVLMSAALLLYFIFNFCGKKRKGYRKEKETAMEESSAALPARNAAAFPYDGSVPYLDYRRNSKKEAGETDEEAEYGNTVFLETAMCRTEHKLYGTNKGNKYHISLGHLPCTVGKLEGSVDVVIKDNTVSRIHARFTSREEGICVTDLNSTNGTFKNGLRLEPNETVIIERGDELRFGRMTFCYR